jgi:uncharacterized protein involved in outer membrane biogenesis
MKRLIQVVLVVAVLGAAAVLLAWNSLDLVVKWALEHYGPDIAGVPVKVREVQISPLDGRGAIRGLEIGNPAGFTAPRAARLGEIRVAVDPRTVARDVVHVHELAIEAPQLTFERGSKASNLDAIQEHIQAYVKRSVPVDEVRPGGARSSGARRYVIDRISIKGARVTMTTAGLKGQGLQFDIPEIELRDLGKSRGGLTAGEASAQVASVLQNRIAQKLLTNAELLRRGGVEGAVDALKGLLK